MIEIFKLTKRHVDSEKDQKLPYELEQIKIFSTFVGHGIGTIDYSEKVAELSEEEYAKTLENSGEYTRFKIGNLSKYFEVEIFPQHVKKLLDDMSEGTLRQILKDFKEGYLILRKDFSYE